MEYRIVESFEDGKFYPEKRRKTKWKNFLTGETYDRPWGEIVSFNHLECARSFIKGKKEVKFRVHEA